MKRAVISGATGAIGTALVRELIEQETEVLVLCREDSARRDVIPGHPLVRVRPCSLEGLGLLENDSGEKYDVFYHLAWAGTTGAARNDVYLQNSNVKYALDAVSAAARLGCHTFVGAGSQAEYGRVEGMLREDTPAFPETGYGMAKQCAGQMTRMHARALGMKHIWMRVLSVYGPNDTPNSMVMYALSSLARGEVPQFTPAEQLWDYLYSGDAARAFRLAAEKGQDGSVYVLGSGQARSLAEYILEIRDIAAPDGQVALGALPYGPGQVMHLQADITALHRDTGFVPQTEFAEGIRKITEAGIIQ